MNTNQILQLGIYILLIGSLCTSCYTYKPVEGSINSIEIDKKYKIVSANGNKTIMRFSRITDTSLVRKYDGKELEIPLKNVKQIKKGEFSAFKTFVVLPISALAGVATWIYVRFIIAFD